MLPPDPLHRTRAELDAGLDHVRRSPGQDGEVRLLVRRPRTGAREVMGEGELTPADGLVGDNWRTRGNLKKGPSDPAVQITVMNARAAALVAVEEDRWPLAGDQIYVDFDISIENLPAGTRFAVGTALLEVSAEPHTGCAKFVSRFGVEAMKFVNSPAGRALNLRGINARVIEPGVVRVGDRMRKLSAP